jgi:hypothetical protein
MYYNVVFSQAKNDGRELRGANQMSQPPSAPVQRVIEEKFREFICYQGLDIAKKYNIIQAYYTPLMGGKVSL